MQYQAKVISWELSLAQDDIGQRCSIFVTEGIPLLNLNHENMRSVRKCIVNLDHIYVTNGPLA